MSTMCSFFLGVRNLLSCCPSWLYELLSKYERRIKLILASYLSCLCNMIIRHSLLVALFMVISWQAVFSSHLRHSLLYWALEFSLELGIPQELMHVCVYSASQSYPTLCDAMNFCVHGIFQARILEWVAISFSRGIFPTQGLNLCLLCLLHWQVVFYHCVTWEAIHVTVLCNWELGQGVVEGTVSGTALSRWKKK